MTTQAASLEALIRSSFGHWKSNLTTIVVGAILFGVLSGMAGAFFGSGLEEQLQELQSFSGTLPDVSRIEELSELAATGDEAAIAELESLASTFEAGGGADVFSNIDVASLASGMSVLLLVALVVTVLSTLYFTIMALQKEDDPGAVLSAIPALVLPFLGIMVWVFLRSFVWIPILGFILVLILGPRFIAANVLLVRDKKGVFESATLSWKGTKGYWLKIIGNVIVAIIIAWVLSFAVGLLLAPLAFIAGSVATILQSIVGYFVTAWTTIFTVKLAETILEHPKAG